jgi:hypothetical protein
VAEPASWIVRPETDESTEPLSVSAMPAPLLSNVVLPSPAPMISTFSAEL